MLRSFRVANHRSIRAAQELVLLPAYDKSRPVTPVAALYGANASGKSNVLDALTWMRTAVLDSFASWTPGAGVPRVPFKLDPAARAEASEFAVDLLVDGVRHHYGLVVNDEAVVEEWLHTYPKGRRRIIFERDGDRWTFGTTVRGALEAVRNLTRDNTLFLSVAARANLTECEPLFAWFANALTIARPTRGIDKDVERSFSAESPWRSTVLALLRAADLGIADVQLSDLLDWDLPADLTRIAEYFGTIDSDAPPRDRTDLRQLLFFHGQLPVPLSVHEESAGTRTWLNLVLAIATALATPKVLLIDEADTTLHPHLARHLVNLFRSPETNPLGAQLIFTSHDATMLDEDTLSRDEIWFVEKDPTAQTTRLYSLAEFRPRKHENTERRYLAGSYGAVPVLSEFALHRALARGTDPDAA